MNINSPCCPLCSSKSLELRFLYDAPQDTEKNFQLSKQDSYRREMHGCKNCGHFLEYFDINQNGLYSEEYVTSTYKDLAGIKNSFDRINSLNPSLSDNIGRVKYVNEYCNNYWKTTSTAEYRLLDVGAGLGVFPYQMKKIGWDCTAIDMDERLVNHHKQVIGIESFCGDLRAQHTLGLFELITFNKVLEHIKDPVEVLTYAKSLLKKSGLIYVELPDGESAAVEGKTREEFLIGHMHVFSFASFALLIKKSGLELICCERIREPSSKYTLRGFMRRFDVNVV